VPQRLTTLWVSTACCRDGFTFYEIWIHTLRGEHMFENKELLRIVTAKKGGEGK
jgi:hypothetical protein